MNKHRVRVLISGRVHGVYFRAYTQQTARLIGITGEVRNLPDGRVEAIFEGDVDNVKKMLAWCNEGSPMSRVDSVEVLNEIYTGEFANFEITQ